MSETTNGAGEFFDGLEPAAIETLRSMGRRRRFSAGAMLFLEGEPGGTVIVLLEGKVKAFATTLEGRELILSLRGPGELIGEIAALGPEDSIRTASVEALEPVVAQVLTVRDFERFLEEHPKAALVLLRSVLARLEQAVQMRVEYGSHDVVGRVARRLCELADLHGEQADDGVRIAVGLSQDELASWAVASRESVAKVLGRFRRQEMIRTDRKSIVVLDGPRLRKVAGL